MTSQSRRRNGPCLLRMRENCPFRKLRRNCCDSRNALVPDWSQCRSCPQSQTGPKCCMNTIETFCNPSQPDSRPREELSAMDTDMNPPTATSNTIKSTRRSSNNHHINPQRQQSFNGLDRGVDPETGEQAQW